MQLVQEAATIGLDICALEGVGDVRGHGLCVQLVVRTIRGLMGQLTELWFSPIKAPKRTTMLTP